MTRTIVNYILDESGSMSSCREATIEGMNKYLKELREQSEVDYVFTLTKFNGAHEQICNLTPIKDVPELTSESYTPGGSTALYDAVAHAVKSIVNHVTPEDRVLCVIDTDGGENASRETTRQQVFDMITAREGEGNWTFVFMGANQDSWANASRISVGAANTANYVSTPEGRAHAMHNLSVGTRVYSASPELNSKNFWKGQVNISESEHPAPVAVAEKKKEKKKEDFFASKTLH